MSKDVYYDHLKKLRNCRYGLLRRGVIFLQDNGRPYTAKQTVELLESIDWDVLHHPANLMFLICQNRQFLKM